MFPVVAWVIPRCDVSAMSEATVVPRTGVRQRTRFPFICLRLAGSIHQTELIALRTIACGWEFSARMAVPTNSSIVE